MRVNIGAVINKIRGQIEEIRSLLINWGSNCINQRPRIKVENAANYRGGYRICRDAIELFLKIEIYIVRT
jgi:hypothetical protein